MGRYMCYRESKYLRRGPESAFHLFLVLFVALASLSFQPAVAKEFLEVQRSDSEVLRFSVSELDFRWREVSLQDGASVFFDPSVAGFSTVGLPAGPRSPRSGGWLVIPPGTRPELVVINENWQDAGSRRLMVQGVPIILQGEEPGMGSTSEIMVLPGQEIPTDAPVPNHVRRELNKAPRARMGSAVELGEPVPWRGRRIVSWTMVPLRYDNQGIARQTLASGTWEIRFVADDSAGKALAESMRPKTTSRGDTEFGGIFLNQDLLTTQPTETAVHGTFPQDLEKDQGRGQKTGTLLGSMEGRLAVTRTDLFKVTHARLLQLGFIPDVAIQEDQIRLYQRRYMERLDDGSGQAPYVEVEVPIHMVGEGDTFSGDDYFLFYGLRLRDDTSYTGDVGAGPEEILGSGDHHEMNNEANFYWVAASEPDMGETWSRMETTSLAAASTTPLASYRRTEHHEEQLGFRELQPKLPDNVPPAPRPDIDRVFYNNSRDTEVNVGFNPLWSPDPNGTDAEIEIGVAGLNYVTRPLQFHYVNDENFSTLLRNYDMETALEVTLTSTISALTLAGESGKVTMSPRTTRTDRVFTYLNWVRLSYDALYQAVDGQLAFHTGDEAGSRPIEVTGFTSSDLGLVNLDDPRNPVWVELSSGNILADGDDWKLSIEPVNSAAESRDYFVAQDMGAADFQEFSYYQSLVADRHVNPTELSGAQPDLVVITHEEFANSLDTWLQHRVNRSGGELEYHVVQVQDLYDWYSGGLKDPWALKRFTEHAITHWGSWALTIIGDANENARELAVLPSAREWSKDWVPTHYHTQDTGQYSPELMAADKWFATFQAGQNYPVENFPDGTYGPWEMYVGRLPCNSVEELAIMVDKIMTVENSQPGQAWRKRGVFFADDAWSNGYGDQAYTHFTYRSWEEDFAESERDSLVPTWANGSPITLDPVDLYLADYLDPYWEGHGLEPRPSTAFKNYAESDANPPLLAALSGGALVAHYQGHGNPYVLSSEYWMEDRLGLYRKDVSNLTNSGSPWVFFGMGCHIADWAQTPVYNEAYPRERSLCEKMLVRSGAGASATYGSSGYEYIDANRIFGEYIFRRWLRTPPASSDVDNETAHRSRWMLGELLWAGEADILAVLGASSTYREMVAQYTLLGDPLMILDAGEAEVSAAFTDAGAGPVEGETDVVALDASNRRLMQLTALDEAGIDRIEIIDSHGNDLTAQISTETLPAGAQDHQEVLYDLDIPVNPYDHQMTVRVFDTGGPLATDRHYELVLNFPQTSEFVLDGETIDPETFVFPPEEPLAFSASVTGAAWLSSDMAMELTSENLDLSNVVFDLDKDRAMSVQFTAVAPEGTSGERSVVLDIEGHETTHILQAAEAELPLASISNVVNFPNPMQTSTRFIFESGASNGQGVVRVYAVSGRHVAHIPFHFSGGGNGIINWDGRDSDGDELANGTYLYRIEMDTPSGHITSDMQRLVMMR